MVMKNDPIGKGVVCPFRRDGKGDFANGGGMELLKSDIGELLGIIGPTVDQPGELPWDCGRGSRLLVLKHRGIYSEMVRATADQMVTGVIRMYEPRVRVGKVGIVSDENTLKISVSYIPLSYANVAAQQATIQTIS